MEQNHLLAIVGPHLVSVATRQVLSPLYSYNLILSSLRLAACSLRLVACSLSPELLAIANGPGKPGPLVLLVFYSLLHQLHAVVFQTLRDIIVCNEEAQPEQTLLFRYMHPNIIGYFLLSFKSYYKIIFFYFHIYSFLNSSYHILDRLSSLPLEACGPQYKLRSYSFTLSVEADQPTPDCLCSSGGGALTDPRSNR